MPLSKIFNQKTIENMYFFNGRNLDTIRLIFFWELINSLVISFNLALFFREVMCLGSVSAEPLYTQTLEVNYGKKTYRRVKERKANTERVNAQSQHC